MNGEDGIGNELNIIYMYILFSWTVTVYIKRAEGRWRGKKTRNRDVINANHKRELKK